MIRNTIIEAIQNNNSVMLMYKDDFSERMFNPYFLYISNTGKTLVGGWQVNNPAKPLEGNQYHKFNVSFIKNIKITNESFQFKQDIPYRIPSDCRSLICAIQLI